MTQVILLNLSSVGLIFAQKSDRILYGLHGCTIHDGRNNKAYAKIESSIVVQAQSTKELNFDGTDWTEAGDLLHCDTDHFLASRR